ncbi:MAG: Stk1 family PASTA domain-containing Ser/Thr kinase [Acutalibacteraceae bacterium]|nr:Stk1 family PASTA domain-containing Ser/Thr kinase [Acutalibacteraceae bacterium]
MENYVGKRLDGRYEIQDVIGVGGMAVVYKAYDNIDDRIVAVKVLKEEYLANEEFRRRFKNESKAIAVLSHPNIVKVYDVSFGDRLQYIVMEYIEGITLKEYIEKRGVIDWNEALFFIIQILRALQHAHDKGVVHRDVKPQNIMLLENGTIKVADFGIARFSHSESRTVTEKAIGSVHYISPEQAKGELTDEKADIYSVGIMLYEMLTGKLPFDADNAVSVALMQVNSEAQPPRTINERIPVGFEQITMKAMQKSTRERYQSAAEVLMDLEELKRNPNVKFDYQSYSANLDATRPIGKIQEKTRTIPVVKSATAEVPEKPVMVSPSAEVQRKVKAISQTNETEAVQDVQKKGINKTAIIAGVAVAVVLFVLILLGTKLFKNDEIEVDSFVGMNYELQIKDNAEYNEKYNFEIYYASFSDAEEGSVYDQDPKAGTSVEEGSTIILYIAKAGEGQVVPDFAGKNFREASNTLENLGFKVVVVPTEDTSVSVGQVVRTEPAANTTLAVGATVTVYYAADTDSDKLFKMPKLEGKSLDAAKEILEEKGLVLYKVESADSSVEKDYVLNQSPADGSPVREGDTVVLTVSSGCVNAQKTLALPKVGTVTVKVLLDGDVVKTESVNTALNNNYVVSASGSEENSELAVYLNDALFYEATVNFTREPAKFTKEKTYDVAFYADVMGLSETEAVNTLNSLGYKNITVKYEDSIEKEGTVINQSPAYSTAPNLDKTTSIVLTVSKKDVTQPNNQPTLPEESSTEEQPVQVQ